MKYRRLSDLEFKHYEEQFHEFLNTRDISEKEWNKIEMENTELKEKLLDDFSDKMIENILQVTTLIEHRSPSMIRYFTLDHEKINMVGLQVKGNSLINFEKEKSSVDINEKLDKAGGEIKLIAANKEHNGDLLEAKFNLLERGCTICQDPSLYDVLKEQVDLHKK